MKNPLLFLLAAAMFFSCNEEASYRFTLKAENRSFFDCPVMLNLEELEIGNPDRLILFEDTEGGPLRIEAQFEYTQRGRVMWFIAGGLLEAGGERSFFLEVREEEEPDGDPVELRQESDALLVLDNGREVLSYQTSEKMPPKGVDTLYRRSAYIHPLRSPGGEVLTRIQPPDHYHHYGIWGPWTKTSIKGRYIDYWNLAKGEGTVRFSRFHFLEGGSLFGLFGARQEHVDLGVPGGRVTMEEDYFARYWRAGAADGRYILDIRSALTNILEDTIHFEAYRYGGGIGYRARGDWNAENSSVLTSEGKEREEADGTRARWCIIRGVTGSEAGYSGILFLSHPGNREHPEPMRVWPEESNDGQLFFEFCPIRHREWVILPGNTYALQYRLIVFDGEMTPEEAEMYWNGFAYQPEIYWNN